MIYRVLALFCLGVFYCFFFGKMIVQKKHGIITDKMAKGKVKDRVFYIELILKITAFILPVVEVISVLTVNSNLIQKVFGLYFLIVGDAIFGTAIVTMRDSWRAGVAEDEKERKLVTEGIYRFSRNPAFLGFDLVYLGILVMFFNPILLVITLISIILMHLQILNEEKFLEKVYGEEYQNYKKQTSRYAGLGKITFDKAVLFAYVILFVWSVLYFFTCLAYAGFGLSLVWIWPGFAVFAAIRIRMLWNRIDGNRKTGTEKAGGGKTGSRKIPGAVTVIYRVVFILCLAVFIVVEAMVIHAMTSSSREELEYVVVLGAGLRGTEPLNPLKARIEKAYEYMSENETTILVASGGQGPGESITEAQCIRDKLVERGIDQSRILLEDKSTSTEENLSNSLAIIGRNDASVGIITNGFHEFRANLIAEKTGYTDVYSVPAVTLFPVGIHYTVREFIGVVWYIVFGK